MDSNNFDDAVDTLAATDANLENEGLITKHLLNKIKKGFQNAGRQGQYTINALQDMAYATRWSQEAEKMYYDMHSGRPKTNADYDKAKELLNKGIHVLDQVLEHFPTTYSSVFALKKKLFAQLKDIEYLQRGIEKTPEELNAEVEANLRHAEEALKANKNAD